MEFRFAISATWADGTHSTDSYDLDGARTALSTIAANLGELAEGESITVELQAVTIPQNPAEVAAAVAKVIRNNSARWDQGKWFDSGDIPLTRAEPHVRVDLLRKSLAAVGETCGSTACVAGWAAILAAPPGSVIVDPEWSRNYLRYPDHTRHDLRLAGKNALGLSEHWAGWLFSEKRTQDEVLRALDLIVAGPAPLSRTFTSEYALTDVLCEYGAWSAREVTEIIGTAKTEGLREHAYPLNRADAAHFLRWYPSTHSFLLVTSELPWDHSGDVHVAGRGDDCPACEARCHCAIGAERTRRCVFDGEHNC